MTRRQLPHRIGAVIFALTFIVGVGFGSATGQGRRNRNWSAITFVPSLNPR